MGSVNAPTERERTLHICQDLQNKYEAAGGSFLDCIITSDEMWCHHYEQESKQQSMEWQHVNSPLKKKFKTQPSEGTVMCIFSYRKGVILLNSLEPGQIINSVCYIMPLTKLRAWSSRVRTQKNTVFILQHDNIRPHINLRTVEHIVHDGWTDQPH